MNDDKPTIPGIPIDATSDDQRQPPSGHEFVSQEHDTSDGEDIFSVEEEAVLDKIAEGRLLDLESQGLILEQLHGAANDTINEAAPPSVLGEQSVSGDMADPESDDDTLLNSHQVGLRMDEDYENPKPLNIAADVAAAERSRRGS